MKKVFLIIVLLFSFISVHGLELDIQSKNAILVNTDDNNILYEKDAYSKASVASLTKIMTAIITLENVKDLNSSVFITSDDLKDISSNNLVAAGFKVGDKVTYLDLLYGLLLPSGADAALALSHNVFGYDKFISLMNEKVAELKLKNTHFSNPIGLDSDSNYSTAYDMSLIFMYALKNDVFKKIITTSSYRTSNGGLTFKSSVRHNAALGDYLLGGKTGTTSGAGLCLASIAKDGDSNLLLVTLGAPYDKKGRHNIEDAKTIYEYFINNYSRQVLFSKKDTILSLKTKYSNESSVSFYPDKDIAYYLPNNVDKSKLNSQYDGVKVVTPNMSVGTNLGHLKLYYDKTKIYNQDIVLKKKVSFSLMSFLKYNFSYVLGGFFVLFIFVIFVIRRRVLKI